MHPFLHRPNKRFLPVAAIVALVTSMAALVAIALVPTFTNSAADGWTRAANVQLLPGRIEFAKPHWNQKKQRYSLLEPWKCGLKEATLDAYTPIAWVGRSAPLRNVAQQRSGYRIFQIENGRPVQLVTTRLTRDGRIDGTVRGLLTVSHLGSLGMFSGEYRLEYFSGVKVLAQGDFKISPSDVGILYGY